MNCYVLKTRLERVLPSVLFLLFILAVVAGVRPAHAEYGDLVLNEHAEKEGMPPAVFPHWFHRIRFRCKVCHADLGFKFKAGGSGINMLKIIDGQYCGACHNGEIAWSVENCNLCHTGIDGQKTHVDGSTLSKLVVPVKSKNKKAK
ncbi:MAG TPA: hypothetical protein ENI98_09575 [Gammaproteobacteria bacterium]|nr:hypothetical protein [Gammaproteobacteria bacterium]